jgi:hypothetical protein
LCPVSRSKIGVSSSIDVFIAVVLTTLVSGTAFPQL